MARRDVQRRTRRSASAIQGAARDTAGGRLTRLRAGARSYRATRAETRRDVRRRSASLVYWKRSISGL